MLFLIGNESFDKSFFMKLDEHLALKRDILGSENMSTKLQMSIKHEMTIEYREECGKVTMKSCVLNDKQRRGHCDVVNNDRLCVNKVPFFKVKIFKIKYFGEAVYDQWNWEACNIDDAEYICKNEFDILLLIGIKLDKPVLDISKLRSVLDLPKDPFILTDYTSGNEDTIATELLEKAIVQPSVDISRIILIDFHFYCINLTDPEYGILQGLCSCFNAALSKGTDNMQEFQALASKFPNKIVLAISNTNCELKVISFNELYAKIVNDSLETASRLNTQTAPVPVLTYTEGQDFMAMFMAGSSAPHLDTSEIQTQSYNNEPAYTHQPYTQSSMVEPSRLVEPSTMLMDSQINHTVNRSFVDTQMAFNQSLREGRTGEKASFSQTLGISQDEIKRRLLKKKQMVERQKMEEERKLLELNKEPTEEPPQKKQRISEEVIKVDLVQSKQHIAQPVQVQDPVIVSGHKEKQPKQRVEQGNIKIMDMGEYRIVPRFPLDRLITVQTYSTGTLIAYNK